MSKSAESFLATTSATTTPPRGMPIIRIGCSCLLLYFLSIKASISPAADLSLNFICNDDIYTPEG
jgi:hypothetical protein